MQGGRARIDVLGLDRGQQPGATQELEKLAQAQQRSRLSARGQRALAGVCGELQVLLPIEGLVDLDALKGRLDKDLAKAEKEINGLAGRLANPNFAGKAPPEVVAECQANLAEAQAQAELARQRLADLGA